jgi:ketosteroid isomerase-like protein
VSDVIGATVAKRKVREGFDCLNERNLTKWITYWADNVVLFYPGTLSVSGKIEGKQAIAAWYEKFFKQLPAIHYKISKIYVWRQT